MSGDAEQRQREQSDKHRRGRGWHGPSAWGERRYSRRTARRLGALFFVPMLSLAVQSAARPAAAQPAPAPPSDGPRATARPPAAQPHDPDEDEPPPAGAVPAAPATEPAPQPPRSAEPGAAAQDGAPRMQAPPTNRPTREPPAFVAPMDFLPRLLELCQNPTVAARRFCIDMLAAMGDPQRLGRLRLRHMAARDPALHAHAAAAVVSLYGEQAPAYQEGSDALWPPDPSRHHLVFFPTAHTTPRKKASFTVVNIGYWDINYGVTDQIEVGLRTTPPITVVGFFPQIKLSFPFEGGSLALHGMAGFFLSYVADEEDLPRVGVAGGGPILTLGSRTLTFNAGVEGYALFVGDYRGGALVAHAGLSTRVARRVALGVELVMPGIFNADSNWLGKIGLVLYGVRILGESIWGDISFALPICEECGHLYRYLPIGIPLLGFGFSV